MKITIKKDYDEISKYASIIFLNQLALNKKSIFGLATGTSVIGLYKEIINSSQKYTYDFSKIKTFNLDEYYSLNKENKQSYNYYMYDKLFNHININKKNIFIPDGKTKNITKYCSWYEKQIENNKIDLQILGIGANGHIGFNEPGSDIDSITRLVDLDNKTISDNSRFFEKSEIVPKQAITIGISTILKAKKIILIACGKQKAEAIKKLIEGKVDKNCPASFLKNHPDVEIIIDKEASSLLKTNTLFNTKNAIRILNSNITLKNKNILIISPHPDDTAISCGGLVTSLGNKNTVYSLLMTLGKRGIINSNISGIKKSNIRKIEVQKEAEILKYKLLIGDFKFYEYNKKYWNDDLLKLDTFIKQIKPDIIILPSSKDEHPTHVLSFELIKDYLIKNNLNIETWCYEGPWSTFKTSEINLIFFFGKQILNIKNRAIKQHKSQISRSPFIKASKSLSELRASVLPEKEFAGFGKKTPYIGDYIEAYKII